MNALQASERLAKLKRRADALARVIYYLDDEREYEDDVDELRELQRYTEDEAHKLVERLSEVHL